MFYFDHPSWAMFGAADDEKNTIVLNKLKMTQYTSHQKSQ